MNREPHKPLPDEAVSRLIRLGATGASRPVDDLIARLSAPDGPAWLRASLDGEPMRGLVDSTGSFQPRSLPELDAIKSVGKTLGGSRTDANARRLGTLAYFLAIAAAKLQHNTWMSSQPEVQLREALADLATALPGELQLAVTRASM